MSLFDSTFSALYFFLFLLSVFISFFFLFYLELFPELLYTKDMANLRHSAANESEDTDDVCNSPTQRGRRSAATHICIRQPNSPLLARSPCGQHALASAS